MVQQLRMILLVMMMMTSLMALMLIHMVLVPKNRLVYGNISGAAHQ